MKRGDEHKKKAKKTSKKQKFRKQIIRRVQGQVRWPFGATSPDP